MFALFFLTGITLGTLLSQVVGNFDFLQWLNAGQEIGLGVDHPLTIDLSVIKLSFGFSVNINIIKMICIIFCLWLYTKFSKGL
ncbi:MAG: DUF4321 domain-containing protein [Christensenellaceae bacterium]